AVQGQDERGVLGDLQGLGAHRHALLCETSDLRHKGVRIENNTIADDRQLARTHYSRWEKRELVACAINDERMAGIVPPLKTHDDVSALRKPVNDFTLTFVAPLRADDYDVCHSCFLPRARRLPAL